MRSVVYGRAEFIRAQQVAAAGLQASTGRTVWPAVQVPGEHQREQADVATRFADRLVLGDPAELAAVEPERAGVADVSQRGVAAGE